MIGIFYQIIIFPLVQILQICFIFIFRLFRNIGMSVCGVSLAVSVLTLPLYMVAEGWQKRERDIQKKLKVKTDKIKSVFRGDEQYMIMSAYFRQNRYHPVFALRSSISLLIQVPFFIAAYSYLSGLDALQGASFLFLKNMGTPDGIVSFGAFSVNVLPLLMTLFNLMAGAIYTKGLALKEKVQINATAIVFLILLYNSPSGLVLYWTLNNVFSLIKNIFQKIKNPSRILYGIGASLIFVFDIYVLFFHGGHLVKRLFITGLCIPFFLLPLIIKKRESVKKAIGVFFYNSFSDRKNLYFLYSILVLFILSGFIIPGSLIKSSVYEFSYIEQYTNPYPFMLNTLFQSFGLFVFWPVCLYFMFSGKVRLFFSLFFSVFCIMSVFNVFSVFENYGFLTNNLVFSEPKPVSLNLTPALVNGLLLFVIVIVFFLLLKMKKEIIIHYTQILFLISLGILGVYNIIIIQNDFTRITEQRHIEDRASIMPLFNFSKNADNVVLVMLDRGISGYVPYIFEERPELREIFSGFVYYPNCVSFASHTLVGAPPLYGGYEYTPGEINRRDNIPLLEKQKEAFLMLPRLFSGNDFSVSVNDPPFDNYQETNLGLFKSYPEIRAENILGKYTKQWLDAHPDVSGLNITHTLNIKLLRFSLFKMFPLAARNFLYDKGDWLYSGNTYNVETASGGLTLGTIDEYVVLDSLPALSAINDNEKGAFNEIYCNLTHNPAFFEAPEYTPVQNVINRGSGPFADEDHYHVNMVSFLLLAKWFTYLKNEGVYDNTRIVIVSDHGANIHSNFKNNILLPSGQSLETYNALLLFKDFNSQGSLSTDSRFMTNADTPLLAVRDIIEDPVNPFTGNRLVPDKEDGAYIAAIPVLDTTRHEKFRYRIPKGKWLHVKDDIFDPANWAAPSEIKQTLR
jgi:membrane protein insertase Oxa1/YidC/SpoIIIJ